MPRLSSDLVIVPTGMQGIVCSKLPLELCDYIVDYLWPDGHALAACSLTCRAWLPTARMHKYRAIDLHGPNDCIALESLLDSFVVSSRGIADWVRVLTIATRGSDPENGTGESWNDHRVQRLLKRFHSVERLSLSNLRWDLEPLQDETWNCFLTISPMIRSLELRSVAFSEFTDILQLLSAFPRLDEVHLSYTTWAQKTTLSASRSLSWRHESSKSARIKSLDTDATSYIALVTAAWLLSPAFELYLDRLTWLTHSLDGDLRVVDQSVRRVIRFMDWFLDLSDQNLEHEGSGRFCVLIMSSISMLIPTYVVALPEDFSISLVRRLSSLHIRCNDSHTSSLYTYLPMLLGQIRSIELPEIVIELADVISTNINLDYLDWWKIDAKLAQLAQRLPQLTVTAIFNVQVAHDSWLDDAIEAVASLLPKLQAQGTRLRITCYGHGPDIIGDGKREHWLP